jgi:hypothetical protein
MQHGGDRQPRLPGDLRGHLRQTAPTQGSPRTSSSGFGARPDVQQMPNVPHGRPSSSWPSTCSCSAGPGSSPPVPMTFMPELFPGMLLRIPSYGFQAYVQGSPTPSSSAPAAASPPRRHLRAEQHWLGHRTDLLALLPLGGRKRMTQAVKNGSRSTNQVADHHRGWSWRSTPRTGAAGQAGHAGSMSGSGPTCCRGKSAHRSRGRPGSSTSGTARAGMFAVCMGYTGGDRDFTVPVLGTGWTDAGTPYQPVGYIKDADGWVSLRGRLKAGTGTDAVAFTSRPDTCRRHGPVPGSRRQRQQRHTDRGSQRRRHARRLAGHQPGAGPVPG